MTAHFSEAEFLAALRGALRHLYDPATLRRNPLNALLYAQQHAQGLQEVLLEAVQALSPARGSSLQSDARRTHQILLHRYVEQFSQNEVAVSLGLSARQLRRQEQLAIRSLGEYLRTRYALSLAPRAPASGDAGNEDAAEGAAPAGYEPYQEDLEWLHQAAPQEFLDVGEMIAGALQTLEPLFQELDLVVQSRGSPDPPRVPVNAIALRQALMITLTTMARLAAGKQLSIVTAAGQSALWIEIQPAGDGRELVLDVDENLAMAQRLMALSGGTLTLHSARENRQEGKGEGRQDFAPNERSSVTLTLPLAQPATLLIVDDNQDALQLVQRYLTGTRYHPVVTRSPVEGLALAQQLKPQIILLDVMLPGMDGWEMLARLRRHPTTEQIPVIICTILPEEQLAWSLGASGFLRKPLARDELLQALQAAKV